VVDEPFRSDPAFWSGLAASAAALLGVVGAAAAAAALALLGQAAWSVAPFAVPACLVVRAGVLSRTATRHTRPVFPQRQAWREAERRAVATAFIALLRRPHRSV
jgi:hypothetical protein